MKSPTIGRLQAIRRYPVKSMLGEQLAEATVYEGGLIGDRTCALRDCATGKIASAKLPHRWRKLLSCAATYGDETGVVEVRLPDGTIGSPAEVTQTLCELLGREVEPIFTRPQGLLVDRVSLEQVGSHGSASEITESTVFEVGFGAPESGFVDAMPIHFITTSTLAAVASASGTDAIEVERFRPNLVIESDLPPFSENEWGDAILSIGEVELAVICPTPRCAVPALAHGPAPENLKLPKLLASLNQADVPELGRATCLGAYARVIRAGHLVAGNAVALHRDLAA